MKYSGLKAIISAFIIAAAASPADAGIVLTLEQSTDLVVGQAATIDVSISGVPTGGFVDFLSATVDFDVSMFELSALSAGDAIPDLTGLSLFGAPGTADAIYDSFFSVTFSPITTNGVFFTMEVIPKTAGAALFDFAFVDGFAVDASFDPTEIGDAGPLETTVEAATVPEPSSVVIMLIGVGGVCFICRHQGRQLRAA